MTGGDIRTTITIASLILMVVLKIWQWKVKNPSLIPRKEKKSLSSDARALGTRIILATNSASAKALIRPILEADARVTPCIGDRWTQSHYYTDDVTYMLMSSPTRSILYISYGLEFRGRPIGKRSWNRFRKEITAEAQRQMIPVYEDVQDFVRIPGFEMRGAQAWMSRTSESQS